MLVFHSGDLVFLYESFDLPRHVFRVPDYLSVTQPLERPRLQIREYLPQLYERLFHVRLLGAVPHGYLGIGVAPEAFHSVIQCQRLVCAVFEGLKRDIVGHFREHIPQIPFARPHEQLHQQRKPAAVFRVFHLPHHSVLIARNDVCKQLCKGT